MPGNRLPAHMRFEAFVDKTENHWMWKGYKLPNGFGRFSYESATIYAHHYAYFLHHGRWSKKGERVVRTCDMQGCVNPEHLDIVKNRRESR